jgi:hypothetical protein
MTIGKKLYDALAAARASTPSGKLTEEEWVKIANEVIDKTRPPAAPRRVNVLGKGLTDDQWYDDLAKDQDLAGIDILEEARKCKIHFKSKNIIPSRARFLRWLAKVDIYIARSTGRQATPEAVAQEPVGWRERILVIWPECSYLIEGTPLYWESWQTMTSKERSKVLAILAQGHP